MTYKEVGKTRGISKQAVQSIERKALQKLGISRNAYLLMKDYYPTRHISLTEYKSTFTSQPEWALLHKRKIAVQ